MKISKKVSARYLLLLPAISILFILTGHMSVYSNSLLNDNDVENINLSTEKVLQEPRGDIIIMEELASTLWGTVTDIQVEGNYAYCVLMNGFVTLDISDPSNPIRLGALPAVEGYINVFKSGDYAYLAGEIGLTIVDVTDPYAPTIVGTHNSPTYGMQYGKDIAVIDTIAVLVDRFYGLDIVNVADPYNPVSITTYDPAGYAVKIDISDSLVYLATETNGMYIFNIADPGAPEIIGSFSDVATILDVTIVDTLAYLAARDDGLVILNIADPSAPDLVGDIRFSNVGWRRISSVCVRDTVAIVSDTLYTYFVNISDPSTPDSLANEKIGAWNVVAKDSLVFIAEDKFGGYNDGVDIYSISDPANPLLIGEYFVPRGLKEIHVQDSIAYLGDWYGNLSIINVADPANPDSIGGIEDTTIFGWGTKDIYVKDTLAFISSGNYIGVLIYNVTDPANPILLGSYEHPGTNSPGGCYVLDSILYIAYGESDGLVTVNIADPTAPVFMGSHNTQGSAWELVARDSLVYLCDGQSGGLIIFNVIDPSNPDSIGCITGIGSPQGIALKDSLAIIAAYTGRVKIVNVADPHNPELIGESTDTDWTRSVSVRGNQAFFAVGAGVQVVSIADPANPILMGEYDTRGYCSELVVKDTIVFVADNSSFMVLSAEQFPAPNVLTVTPPINTFDISNSSNLTAVFDIDLDEAAIDSASFVVNSASAGLVPGSFYYDNPSRTITFNPDNDFVSGDIITATLTDGIASTYGATLNQGFTWSFTAAAGTGSGIFVADNIYEIDSLPSGVIAADFDNDGDIDLGTSNSGSNSISIMMNNGDGTFLPQVTYSVGNNPGDIDCARYDGDSYIDIAVVNGADNTITVLYNDGSGNYGTQATFPSGTNPGRLCSADFDGNGNVDIAVLNEVFVADSISILLNDGDGNFAMDKNYVTGSNPWNLIADDLNNDGAFDIAVTNFGTNDISIYLNDGRADFTLQASYNAGTNPGGIAAVDINGNNFLDLVVSNYNDDSITVLVNQNDGSFVIDNNYYAGQMPNSINTGDIEGDGDLDLLIGSTNDSLYIIINNNNGSFSRDTAHRLYVQVREVIGTDLDNNGSIDLAAVHIFKNLTVYLNQEIITSTIEVTNLNDAGIGSLRWAIDSANTDPDANEIVFALSGDIPISSPLPALTDNMTSILGSTAPDGAHSVILDGSAKASGDGIVIQSSFNKIEGLNINQFSDNGIVVAGPLSTGNTLTNNLIYDNGLLGIDLNDDGVTINDVDDSDSGPNNLLNYPVIDSTYMNPDSTFTVIGHAADSAVIEFYAAHRAGEQTTVGDSSGFGEAYFYIGSDTANNLGYFNYTVMPNGSYEYDQFTLLTATATDKSGNTSEFCENFLLIPSPLTIIVYSPVNIKVTDPVGDYIGKDADGVLTQTIFPSDYLEEPPEYHDSVIIYYPLPGEYDIEVIAETGAPIGSTYAIGIQIDGSNMCVIVEDASVPTSGGADNYTYVVEEDWHYLNGDADRNDAINILDITYLISNLYKGGPPPYPEGAGDANCNLTVNILDITYLISYLYKGGPPPCNIE